MRCVELASISDGWVALIDNLDGNGASFLRGLLFTAVALDGSDLSNMKTT